MLLQEFIHAPNLLVHAPSNQHPVMASTDTLFGGEPEDAVLVPLL